MLVSRSDTGRRPADLTGFLFAFIPRPSEANSGIIFWIWSFPFYPPMIWATCTLSWYRYVVVSPLLGDRSTEHLSLLSQSRMACEGTCLLYCLRGKRSSRESDGCAGGQFLGIQWKSNFYQNVLRAFAKFQKAVRPSEWNNSAPTGRIFMKFDFWVFWKISRGFKFHSKYDINKGYLTWRPMCIFDHISLSSS